ncbi:type II secretion system protein [Candidatus Saccharibacteria bacterium]|nr:type II secretion system protein [Candidatus Saccharibacteria bacterium]
MKRKSGFTILEVVLVLAIAGIIFLMAFLALPSLWSSERDAARRANVMAYISAIKNYQTNNSRGALPVLSGNGPEKFTMDEIIANPASGSWKAFVKDYIGNDFEDPAGVKYNFYIVKCASASGTDIDTGAVCAYQDKPFGAANNPNDPNLASGTDYNLYTVIGATCQDDYAVKTNSSRSVATVYIMERAGRYCYNT